MSKRSAEVSQYFERASFGPVVVDESAYDLRVTAPGGAPVQFKFYGLDDSNAASGPGTFLDQGTPVLVDGVPVAKAVAKGAQIRIFFKPGRIRIEGERSDFVTPGLRFKGHLLPQRLTLADDTGKLVWSPFAGALNLRTGPLLLVPPKVSPAAKPEHVALWLATWFMFESAY